MEQTVSLKELFTTLAKYVVVPIAFVYGAFAYEIHGANKDYKEKQQAEAVGNWQKAEDADSPMRTINRSLIVSGAGIILACAMSVKRRNF